MVPIAWVAVDEVVEVVVVGIGVTIAGRLRGVRVVPGLRE